MHKEKYIIDTYSLSKQELLDARASTEFTEGVDFVKGSGSGPKSAIQWTQGGLEKLLKSKKVDFVPSDKISGSTSGDVVEKKEVLTDAKKLGEQVVEHLRATSGMDKGIKQPLASELTCPGIVKQKFPNRKRVRCEVRGQSVMVLVKDSHFLRLGQIITVNKRGETYVSNFKVDGMGRVHG